MSMTDHLPRLRRPWGGVAGLIHRHAGADEAPTLELARVELGGVEPSIAEWLNAPERAYSVSAAELPPVRPVDLPGARLAVAPVWAESDPDEAVGDRILEYRARVHAEADSWEAQNDQRLERLLARFERLDAFVGSMVSAADRAWENTGEVLRRVVVTRRRKGLVAPLVRGLGSLVESGDVSQATAAAIMSLRSRYLYELDAPSQRLPRLTPELLAQMDAQRTAGAA